MQARFQTEPVLISIDASEEVKNYFQSNTKRLDRISRLRENILSAPYYQTTPKFTALFRIVYIKKGRCAYSKLPQHSYIPTKAESFIGIPSQDFKIDLKLLSTCGSYLSVKQFGNQIKVYEIVQHGLGARFEIKDNWIISKNEVFRMGKTNFSVISCDENSIAIKYYKTKESSYSKVIVLNEDTIIGKYWNGDNFMEAEHASLSKKAGGWALRNLSDHSQTWKFFNIDTETENCSFNEISSTSVIDSSTEKGSSTKKYIPPRITTSTYILQYEQMIHVGGNRFWVEMLDPPMPS